MGLIDLIRKWRVAKATTVVDTPLSFSFPSLSTLETAVARADGPEAKPGLLELAKRGERFHSAVSLFVGNWTVLASNDFEDALRHGREDYKTIGFHRLREGSSRVLDVTDRTDWDTVRRRAAGELYKLLETAEEGGYLDQACDVIGYLNYSASHVRGIFHSFGFFYEHGTREPLWHLPSHASVREMHDLGFHARQSLAKMPETAMDDLVLWFGQHGYEGMQRMTSTTYYFKDNKPDKVVTASLVPDLPALPTQGTTRFYREFGEALLGCYKAMPDRQTTTLVKCA